MRFAQSVPWVPAAVPRFVRGPEPWNLRTCGTSKNPLEPKEPRNPRNQLRQFAFSEETGSADAALRAGHHVASTPTPTINALAAASVEMSKASTP